MIKLVLILLFAGSFTLATVLDGPVRELRARSRGSISILATLLGDSRRMFANHFYAKADAYFHSGFYPGIFDAAQAEGKSHMEEEREASERQEADHDEEEAGFLGKPKDWIDRFGRHFYPTTHTHLENADQREILPWLRLAADLDPQLIQTYLNGSFYLRTGLNKPREAEEFLREGLRANPDSYELLLELGYVYDFNKNDPRAARRLWELALQKWKKQDAAGLNPPVKACVEILDGLVRTDRQQHDLKQLLSDLEALKLVSPNPESIEKALQETREQLGAAAGAPGKD